MARMDELPEETGGGASLWVEEVIINTHKAGHDVETPTPPPQLSLQTQQRGGRETSPGIKNEAAASNHTKLLIETFSYLTFEIAGGGGWGLCKMSFVTRPLLRGFSATHCL